MALSICTIGCGGMSRNGHGPSYAKYAETHPEFERLACCDLDAARAAAYQRKFGFARSYTDFEQMLEVEQPDAVCLIAPVQYTCQLGCQLLDLGYPLFLEKPPGLDTSETDQLIAAAERGGVPTQVALNRRYAPLVQDLKQQLAEAGTPRRLSCEFTRVRRRDDDFATTAIHGIDTVRYLAGADYAEVRFRYQELPDQGPHVANLYLDAVMTNGAVASLSFTPCVGLLTERYTVHTDEQSHYLYFPSWGNVDAPGRVLSYINGEPSSEVLGDASHEMFEQSGFAAENAAFFDALQAGDAPTPNIAESRQSVAVAQCLRERVAEYLAD